MNVVENWYDNQYDEWSRLDRHKIEFEMTKRYMDTYIKGNSLKVLDIGGGPGRYAFYLGDKGHKVTLLDLSQKHINIAKAKAQELGITLDGYIKGDALDLSSFSEEEFDVVLLMGPIYHLTREEDRRKSIQEALHVLKKGGILIAAFISKYAPIMEAYSYLELPETEEGVTELMNYLEDGENKEEQGFTAAFFVGVEEAQDLMSGNGLKQLAFAGVENMIVSKEREIIALPQKDFDRWIDVCFLLSQDKSLLGTSMHFLYIGEK